jgi:hypothetical protein
MNDTHVRIRQAVQQHGAAHVARALDVPRNSLLSYLAGASRTATAFLIEQRASRLDAGAPAATVKP